MKESPLKLDQETLVAYVDKELPADEAAAVEAALVHDSAARESVRLMRMSAAAAAHAFDRVLMDRPPERLLQAASAQAVPFRRPQPARPRYQLPMAAAIAALAVGLAAGYALRGGPLDHNPGYAQAAGTPADPLAEAFDSSLLPVLEAGTAGQVVDYAGAGADRGRIELGGRIATGSGTLCREFSRTETRAGVASRARGIACRSGQGNWSVMLLPASAS